LQEILDEKSLKSSEDRELVPNGKKATGRKENGLKK
jgi:hypothetical protein